LPSGAVKRAGDPSGVSPQETGGGATLDAFLGGRLLLEQPLNGYRAGLDAVFLAAAAQVPEGGRVLDLGCGVGTAGLCLLTRRADLRLVGIELQAPLAALARRNAARNGMAARAEIHEADAAAPPAALRQYVFDAVISNPPYLPLDPNSAKPETAARLAHMESSLDLAGWLTRALAWLKPGGCLTLVHRADRLDEVIAGLSGKAGRVVVLPLWPRTGIPAKRVLIQARKSRKGPLTLHPGIILHDKAGFTAASRAILEGGEALPLA